MGKKKEPSFWSTSANGKTASGGSWGSGKKKQAGSGCPMVAVPAAGAVLAAAVTAVPFVLWPAVAFKVLAVWVVFDLVVFLPLWVAAHGGVRSDR